MYSILLAYHASFFWIMFRFYYSLRDHPNRIDRQQQPDITSENGNTLIICCEGNAGFYEGGCMCTPLELGYSVLGWNHPGFLGSSVSILYRTSLWISSFDERWLNLNAKVTIIFM